MKVETIALKKIKPYWRNPRVNDSAVAAVKRSIEMYGFNVPIVVDKEMVIIAGHTRYKALNDLNWKEVPCIIADLPEEKAKEYRIADNKTNELSDWNMDNLILELREISDIDNMDIYFPNMDLMALLNKIGEVKPVSQDEIDKLTSDMEGKFEKKSAERQEDYVSVICPDCGNEFYLDKKEVRRNS